MIFIALMVFQLLGISMTVEINLDCSKLQFWNKIRRIEDKSCKTDTIYHCAWDLFSDMYKEICWQKRILIRKGQRPTIQGGLHFGLCPEKSYQPVPVVSNYTFGCWFIKSNCTDNGQVDCDHSSPEKDSTCRCDYTAGFAFVKEPKNLYFCIPSEEDCSCYKKTCQHGECLSPDYKCVESYNISGYLNQQCLLTNNSTGKTPEKDAFNDDDSVTVSDAFSSSTETIVAMLLSIFIFPVSMLVILYVCPLHIRKSIRCKSVVNENEDVDIEFNIRGTAFIKEVIWMHNNERLYLYRNKKYTTHRTKGTCILTICGVSKEDEGRYECVATNFVGLKCFGKSKHDLNVVPCPEEQIISATKSEIEQHQADQTYYKTSAVDNALDSLDGFSLLFVVGHEGTGKTKVCLEIARTYSEKGFRVLKFLSNNIALPSYYTNRLPDKNQLYVFDINMNVEHINQVCRDLVDNCKSYCDNDNIKIVITVLTKYRTNVLKDNVFLAGRHIFLEPLKIEEKRKILETHMKHNNITQCNMAYESNYEDQNVLSNGDTIVKMYKQIIDSIVATDTLGGFPKACYKFCSDRSLLHLEHRFFNTPPDSVIRDINAYRRGPNETCKDEYIVLVYIMMNGSLNLTEVKRDMGVFSDISSKLGIPNSPAFFRIKDAAHRLTDDFLKSSDDLFTFYHPNLAKAMWMSYIDIDTDYCMMQCDWNYIVDHVRPLSWESSENETCIKVNAEDIVKRLTTELRRGYGSAWSIGQYLRKYSKRGNKVIEYFCKAHQEEKLDIDLNLNLLNGLSEFGTLFEPFSDCHESWQMLLCKNIDEYGNCLLHYCVLQDYSEMIRQMPDDFIEEYMMVKNTSGYSPCHLEFYFGRLRMIEKHLSKIPRKYEYYTLLNKLFHIGERKFGKYIEPRDFNILGKMDCQSDSLVKTTFGSEVEYRTIRYHLIKIKNETISVVRLKKVPTEIKDNEILSALEVCLNCTVLKQYTERYRRKGKINLTIETGDRIAICNVLSEKDFLEKIMIGSNEINLELDHGDKKKKKSGHQKKLRSSS